MKFFTQIFVLLASTSSIALAWEDISSQPPQASLLQRRGSCLGCLGKNRKSGGSDTSHMSQVQLLGKKHPPAGDSYSLSSSRIPVGPSSGASGSAAAGPSKPLPPGKPGVGIVPGVNVAGTKKRLGKGGYDSMPPVRDGRYLAPDGRAYSLNGSPRASSNVQLELAKHKIRDDARRAGEKLNAGTAGWEAAKQTLSDNGGSVVGMKRRR